MKFHHRNILLILSIVIAGNFHSGSAQMDQPKACCYNIGIYNGMQLDECTSVMVTLSQKVVYQALLEITKTFSVETSVNEVVEAANFFSAEEWDADTIIKLVKNISYNEKENLSKIDFLKKIASYVPIQLWRDTLKDFPGKTFDLKAIMTELTRSMGTSKNRYLKLTIILSYKQWLQSNQGSQCNEQTILAIVLFVSDREELSSFDDVKNYFVKACFPKQSNQGWTLENVVTVFKYVKRAPLVAAKYFLDTGYVIQDQLTPGNNKAWNIQIVCEEIDSCNTQECVNTTVAAIMSAIRMDICSVVFRSAIQTLELLSVSRKMILNSFLSLEKGPNFKMKGTDTHQSTISYLVSVFNAKYSTSVEPDVETETSVNLFIQTAQKRNWGLELQNSFLQTATRNKFMPREYGELFKAIDLTQTLEPNEIFFIMDSFGYLQLNDASCKGLWRTIQSYRLNNILSIMKLLNLTNVVAEPAVYGYFMSKRFGINNPNVITALAVYNAAHSFSLRINAFNDLYTAIEKVTRQEKIIPTIESATTTPVKSVNQLISSLNVLNETSSLQ